MTLPSLTVWLLLLAGAAHGATPPAKLLGPYLQDLSSDGVVVVWETEPAQSADVEVDLPSGTRTLHAPSQVHHEQSVTQLPPGHFAYRLRLADGTVKSGTLHAAPAGDSFTFLVYGDNRDLEADHQAVIDAMREVPGELALNTGDLTGNAPDELLWRRFFAIEEPLLASTPMYPAIGNHELRGDPALRYYHRYFVLPVLPGAAGHDAHPDNERYYSFVAGHSLFIALDANMPANRAQAAWLHATLEAADQNHLAHRFVYFHEPSFSVGPFCGSAVEQGLWVPEFEHHHVDAVFTGHEHCYEHLERNGIRYFVVGGGGAPLIHEQGTCPPYDRAAARLFRAVHQFVRVDVRGAVATLTSIGSDGEVIERVELSAPAPEPSPPPPVPFAERSPAHPVASPSPAAASRTQRGPLPIAVGTLLFVLGALLLSRPRWRRRR